MNPARPHLLLAIFFIFGCVAEYGGNELENESHINVNNEEKRDTSNAVRQLSSHSARSKRQVVKNESVLWLSGVNYYFGPGVGNNTRRAFERAAEAWQKDTCIDFRLNQSAPNAIQVISITEYCESPLGKQRKHQNLTLGSGCEWFGHAAHEIGHALGLHHTQNRHDRNEYIDVKWENMPNGHTSQYNICNERDYINYGPYDYGSIMHYGTNRSKPTMVPRQEHYEGTIGSPMISFLDLFMINEHYRCNERCRNSSTPCKNGGFPHPRNCSNCICPGGYGGRFCDERPNDGGKELRATSKWQALIVKFYNWRKNVEYLKKTYWIKPSRNPSDPQKVKIEVKIAAIRAKYDFEGCTAAGMEIKTNANQNLTGHRYKHEFKIMKQSCDCVGAGQYRPNFLTTCLSCGFREACIFRFNRSETRFCSTKDGGTKLETPLKFSNDSSHLVPVIFYSYYYPGDSWIVVKLEYRCEKC